MVSCFISRLVILIFGTLYPAYASYKAVRTKNVREYVKWMMYWIVFALFTCFETFTDLFLSFWFPFYYELKIITVIYLLSPATNGSSILYRKFVHPILTKREQEIDDYLARAKEQGYHTMLNLGSKGVTYATSLIMQTAIKGGGGLVSHLKKSYSLSDLSEEQSTKPRKFEDEVDRPEYEGSRMMKIPESSPRRFSGGYYPEPEAYMGPTEFSDEEYHYSRIPSAEEISSGYSSGDPLYYGNKGLKGDHLIRTASLGGTSRIRTRASAKVTGLPKRSTLSEEGPAWSSEDVTESQIKNDEYFFLPLSRSSSNPCTFTALNHLVKPEYRHLFGGMNQEPIVAFLNPSKSTQPLISRIETLNIESERRNSLNSESENVTISEIDENNEKKLTDLVIEDIKEKTDSNKILDSESLRNKSKENSPLREKSSPDRSGKYNKKPAPLPPKEDVNTSTTMVVVMQDDDDSEFCTPNSSPKLDRKLNTSYCNLVEELANTSSEKKTTSNAGKNLEVPKKGKAKKKGKKLHLPKMSFSFWNQKGGKQSSESENSSIGSMENSYTIGDNSKTELEFFIPLKGDLPNEKGETSKIQ